MLHLSLLVRISVRGLVSLKGLPYVCVTSTTMLDDSIIEIEPTCKERVNMGPPIVFIHTVPI
jgi:hypothetical protein